MTTTSAVQFDQSAADYHASPACSASRLKKLERSAAHMKYEMDNPEEPTQTMIIGSATHSAILEPDLFVKEWGRLPDGDGRSKAIKKAKADLVTQFGFDHILKPDVYDNVLEMRDSVFGNVLALDLLDGAETEVSHYWTESGVSCKARLDAIPVESSTWNDCVVDLKTTSNASAREFQRSAYTNGYYLQMAHYLAAAQRTRFIFVVVERDPPHCVAIYELDKDALNLGRQEREFLLGQWVLCEAEEVAGGPNAWPGFPVEIQELSLPGYAYTQ